MAYTIFNAERMASTRVESLLRTGRYQVATVNTAVENGGLVSVGAQVSGEREVLLCIAPVAITTTNLYLIDGEEVVRSEETTQGLDDFINLAGSNIRLRRPQVGDYFAISVDGITPLTDEASIAVGSFLIPTAGATTVVEVASAGGTESFVAEIKDITVLGYDVLGGRAIRMFGCEVVKVL